MSLIKKIGLEEVLNRLGLTESQVEIIYRGEIKKLEEQERTILAMIDADMAKMKAINLERHNHSLAMDTERAELEQKVKLINGMRKEVEDSKRLIDIGKRDVSLLQERLAEAKEQFRQERVIYGERLLKLENDEKEFYRTASDIIQKDKDLDNLKDELYLKKRELDISLKEARELTEKLSVESGHVTSQRIALDAEKEALKKREDEIKNRSEAVQKMIVEAKEVLFAEKEEFYKEKKNAEEELRKKQVEIAKKEKFVEDTEASIKRKNEDMILDERKKKK
jgi:hypothetical protein